MNYCVSKKGKILIPGRAIDADFRQLVIDHMLSNGGDSLTGYFPALVNSVADHFKLSRSCVAKLGNSACEPQLLILSGREEILQSISSLKIWIYFKVENWQSHLCHKTKLAKLYSKKKMPIVPSPQEHQLLQSVEQLKKDFLAGHGHGGEC